MKQNKQITQQGTERNKVREQKASETTHYDETNLSFGSSVNPQKAIQILGSNKASLLEIQNSALILQRTIGNRAMVQLFSNTNSQSRKDDTDFENEHISIKPKSRSTEVLTLQRRRVPEIGELSEILTDLQGTTTSEGMSFDFVNAPNFTAHQSGLSRILSRAIDELKRLGKGRQVYTHAVRGMSRREFDALPESERWLKLARAVIEVDHTLQLGDPRLIDTGPRSGSIDTTNLANLVSNANKIFDSIASGRRDTDIGQIFGASNINIAKAKYSAAHNWMNTLYQQNKIVTDRSGYSGEVSLGGLTGFQRLIRVSPETIDNPSQNDSVITLIHESMHAGNNDVHDNGYIHQPSFTRLPENDKLTNAAHFEVVPRRILNARFSFTAIPRPK